MSGTPFQVQGVGNGAAQIAQSLTEIKAMLDALNSLELDVPLVREQPAMQVRATTEPQRRFAAFLTPTSASKP